MHIETAEAAKLAARHFAELKKLFRTKESFQRYLTQMERLIQTESK